jgi:hypothetical protein
MYSRLRSQVERRGEQGEAVRAMACTPDKRIDG